ncbi:MAG: hypothetical protein CM15mV22_1770 [Eurybiavirus sp.]|nr:MAG: hypothetical protein CM15mV22_1770 [Eurybiavirus sp.]
MNGTTPTNTSPHTFQGVSTYQFTPSGGAYEPLTGYMTLTINGHPFEDGDKVQLAKESIKFTCASDSNASIKSYPRTTDPFYNKWINVQKIDANNIKLNVGKAKTDVSTHTWSSANTNAVTRATVYVDTGFTQHTATGSIRTNHRYLNSYNS